MLAESMVTLFPSLKIKMGEENEGFEHFYDPVSHSGFIEMRLRNLRRKLHDDQRRYQSKRSRMSDSSGVSITLELTAEGEEESIGEWTTVIKRMKPSPENLNSIKVGMEKTYSNRRLWFANKSPSLKEIFEEYPRFVDMPYLAVSDSIPFGQRPKLNFKKAFLRGPTEAAKASGTSFSEEKVVPLRECGQGTKGNLGQSLRGERSHP
ncbi:hypothetical protein DPX16_5241 [Anabarilius grahami]|uniref:Uncharacterized protein n=1 Tax=Anabarilius grahami TaxID=495550 RepID=A0A3N0Y1D6_ANAGA|nr:hypothetical protein DPX16_5241 [Anabarilius grahami]